jgi:adenylate cyclase
LVINPAFIPALYMLGLLLTDQARFGWEEDGAAAYEAALNCATLALAADPDCGEAYMIIGYVRTFQRRHDEAVAAGKKAVSLCPSGTDAYHLAGMNSLYAGNFRDADRYEQQAQLLSPINRNESMVDEARAKFHLSDFVGARDIATRVLKAKPRWLTARTTLVAALWNLGSEDEARGVALETLAIHPSFSISRWVGTLPYRRQEDLNVLIEPLRLAGLPK